MIDELLSLVMFALAALLRFIPRDDESNALWRRGIIESVQLCGNSK
jgi:hypothetical protein